MMSVPPRGATLCYKNEISSLQIDVSCNCRTLEIDNLWIEWGFTYHGNQLFTGESSNILFSLDGIRKRKETKELTFQTFHSIAQFLFLCHFLFVHQKYIHFLFLLYRFLSFSFRPQEHYTHTYEISR